MKLKLNPGLAYFVMVFSIAVSCGSSDKFSMPESLGKKIFELLAEGDENAILGLLVTREELQASVNNADMEPYQKKKLNTKLENELLVSEEKHKSEMKNQIHQVIDKLEKYGCFMSGMELESVEYKTRKLSSFPFETGELDVFLLCEHQSVVISTEIVKPQNSWRILDDFIIAKIIPVN